MTHFTTKLQIILSTIYQLLENSCNYQRLRMLPKINGDKEFQAFLSLIIVLMQQKYLMISLN